MANLYWKAPMRQLGIPCPHASAREPQRPGMGQTRATRDATQAATAALIRSPGTNTATASAALPRSILATEASQGTPQAYTTAMPPTTQATA